MKDTLVHLEDNGLAFTMFTDASAIIEQKSTGTRWTMGPVALQEEGPIDVGHVWLRHDRSVCEEYPGRFQGSQEGNRLKFRLHGRQGKFMGTFTCKISLNNGWLDFELSDIDENLPSLIFPTPIESESLVIPTGVGRWIKKPLPYGRRYFWPMYGGLNMRWFGGLNGDAGWLAIFGDGYADAGILAAELAVSPGWLKSLGRWTGLRNIRYGFTSGGYVGLAKTYRDWVRERGQFKPLAEKMEECPVLRNLYGGRIFSIMQARGPQKIRQMEERLVKISEESRASDGKPRIAFTHRETADLIKEAQNLGMKKGLVIIRGWIKDGYDGSHPDIWPPEPALGNIESLKEICHIKDPYFTALHDNYQDMYEGVESWPEGVIRMPDQSLMPGGFWAGGQAYIINPRDGLTYARRNWERIKTLEPRAMFIDTTTAVQAYQSYEPGNMLTRAEDIEYKRELLRFYKGKGLALGSEEAADFGVPYVDWQETRHRRTAGESIPLWPLVFHDAAFCARYSQHIPQDPWPNPSPPWLADMLWGYLLLWGVYARKGWDERKKSFSSTFHVDDWHRRIGTGEMISHRYLTEDCEVEETVFSPGEAIITNFSAEDRSVEGITVSAGGYSIRA
ncbi:MAG: DUF5696 domain-containing protein [Bacillota bacterium]